MYDSISKYGLYRYFSPMICVPQKGEPRATIFISVTHVEFLLSFLYVPVISLSFWNFITFSIRRGKITAISRLLLIIIERCHYLRCRGKILRRHVDIFFSRPLCSFSSQRNISKIGGANRITSLAVFDHCERVAGVCER